MAGPKHIGAKGEQEEVYGLKDIFERIASDISGRASPDRINYRISKHKSDLCACDSGII